MMHFDVVSVCFLLLLVLDSGALVDCTPEWDAECDRYNITKAEYPRVRTIDYQVSSTVTYCRSLCSGRTDCGGFDWRRDDDCLLYNINDQIIDQVAHVSQNWYVRRSYSRTWYSKACGYSLGDSDLSCDSYTDRVYHNQLPARKWRLTYNTYWIPRLLATECQAWCTLFTGCRSVTYRRRHSDSYGLCRLYETTVQDLKDSGRDDDVVKTTGNSTTFTTFDRYCGDGGPYVQGQATLATRPSVNLHTSVKTTTKTAIVTSESPITTTWSTITTNGAIATGSIGPLAQILIVVITVLLLLGGVCLLMFIYRKKRRAKDASNSTPTQPPLPGLPNSPAAVPEDDGYDVYEAVDHTQAGYVRPLSRPFVRGQLNNSDYNNPADMPYLVSQGSRGIFTHLDGDQTNSTIIPEQLLGHLYENSQPAGSQHVYLQMAVPKYSGNTEQQRCRPTTLSSI